MSQNIHTFNSNISAIPLPEKFTYPFYYEPHALAIQAAQELQHYLEYQKDFYHNFGLQETDDAAAIGKMFGVLVVQNTAGELRHLWAYSGKLADSNHHEQFVPTVYDMLKADGYYKKEEAILNRYNQQIEDLKKSTTYKQLLEELTKLEQEAQHDISQQKERIKQGKKRRTALRTTTEDFDAFALDEESKNESILLKKMTKYWRKVIENHKEKIHSIEASLQQLKLERKQKSKALQEKLFKEYAFLNYHNELKSIGAIFHQNPPAGAGECAAPKLLHFAYQNNLKPIAMAEFWWGKSPRSEVRKHRQFYPACRSKCEPILAHMLEGLDVAPNPMAENGFKETPLPILYEDDYVLAVNKPSEFLSVPGKLVTDSVQTRIKKEYPDALLLHRLDMSTSGVLLIAKNETIYRAIQKQFIKRTVTKRYVALLEGMPTNKQGVIDLPLRVDLDNRPFQLVCYDYGKKALTEYELVTTTDNRTRIHFFPITGRTHQLRVHASHQLGLNCPILGDDLYGTKADRLYLHAEQLTFEHPILREIITITAESPF